MGKIRDTLGNGAKRVLLYYTNLHSRSCIKLQRLVVDIVEAPSTVFGILDVKLYYPLFTIELYLITRS
jgi:hypothetical protein